MRRLRMFEDLWEEVDREDKWKNETRDEKKAGQGIEL